MFKSLFGPPDVEKLKTKKNIKGLIKALNYKKSQNIQLSSAKAIVEMGLIDSLSDIDLGTLFKMVILSKDIELFNSLLKSSPNVNVSFEHEIKEELLIAGSYIKKGEPGYSKESFQAFSPIHGHLYLNFWRPAPDLGRLFRLRNHTPLMLSVILGQYKMIESLISHGAELNVHDESTSEDNGWEYYSPYSTALGYAVRFGDKEIMKLLLEAGAAIIEKPIGVSGHPNPTLWVAVVYRQSNAVKLLLEYGANVNFSGYEFGDGEVLLDHAFYNKEIHDILRRAGAKSSHEMNREKVKMSDKNTGYQSITVYTKHCNSCGKKVPSSSFVGENCPHCNVLWSENGFN